MTDTPPPATPPRKQPRDARRQQMIDATIRLIAARGFARTTLTDVARAAGLSHGLVNFHFATKERLLLDTLLFMAEEYRLNWTRALAAAGPSAPEQLAALLAADFDPRIFTPDRIAAWCAYWGEAQARPIYQDQCGSNDAAYNRRLEAICARMASEHGYPALPPARVARVLRVTIEGIWLDQMTMTVPYDMDEARASVMTCAAAFFPRHFTADGLRQP